MSSGGEAAPLQRVLRDAGARLERNGLRAAGRLRLNRVTAAEIHALSGLLGARWRAVLPGADASVDLAALDGALQASSQRPAGLVEACADVCGRPLIDRRAVRAEAAELRHHGWERLGAHAAVARHPCLGGWLDQERATGAAMRTAGGGDPFVLLGRALDVLAVLPADPPQTLARFAARHCGGDPHALDTGQPLDRTVRRGLAHLDREPSDKPGAESRRGRYDRWGIGCDELSSTVLSLGVWPRSTEPRVLTLRELRGTDRLACGPIVFTCENPDVVAAAADVLGVRCPPLICTGGWPSTACSRLLRAVLGGGAAARHHGDMDPEGLRILDRLLATSGGSLWRMDLADYRRHASSGAPLAPGFAPDGLRAPALRDLADEMTGAGRIVQEEQTLDLLLADLAAANADRS
ncbi:MAG TPA: TIGR02679 family protein [Solirubrobacteraceae bacterium]|nr:TIGR02679 family protein [Solirubrobacteraceae bacterium]